MGVGVGDEVGESGGSHGISAVSRIGLCPLHTHTLNSHYPTQFAFQNNVAGGEGVVGVYGSITNMGTKKILLTLFSVPSHHFQHAVLFDAGAGLGRYVCVCVHARLCFGRGQWVGLQHCYRR